MKKTLSLLLALVMVVSLLAGCGAKEAPAVESETPETTEAPAQEATTPVAEDLAAESETPMVMQWYQGSGVYTQFECPYIDVQSLYPYMVFDRLSELNTTTNQRYWQVAESMEHSEDMTTLTIKVREGIKWHDGEALTVDDVVFSMYFGLVEPNSSMRYSLLNVVGAEAVRNGEADTIEGLTVDGNTITLTFVGPQRTALNDIGNLTILPAHCFGENPDFANLLNHDYWKQPIGSGPYKISEVSAPDYFKLVRNDDYWGEKAGIKNVTFVTYSSKESGTMAMAAGDVDFGTRQMCTSRSVAEMINENNPDVKVITQNSYVYRALRFNLEKRGDGPVKEALLNEKTRLGINLIIDEAGFAEAFDGQAVATQLMFNPNDPQYPTELTRDYYNLEEAKKLLEEGGWNFEDTLDIFYYHVDANYDAAWAYIKQLFDMAGVKTNIVGDPNDSQNAMYTEKNYDLLCFGGNVAADYQGLGYDLQIVLSNKIGQIPEETMAEYQAASAKYNNYSGATSLEGAIEMMELNFDDNYLIPLIFLNNAMCYNTAHISVPETVLTTDSTSHYEWENWKVLH